MKLRLKVQKHLVTAYVDGDNGEWIFTLCRSGLSQMLGQRLLPGDEWLVEFQGQILKPLRKITMASWKLNYGINPNGAGSDKLKCNLTNKGGDGLQLVMGGAIPTGLSVGAETAIQKVVEASAGLDGLDANNPANHVKYLRTVAAFCTDLADAIEGE